MEAAPIDAPRCSVSELVLLADVHDRPAPPPARPRRAQSAAGDRAEGEFSEGALGIKGVKKRAWKALADALGLYRGAIWQATSPQEVSQIEGAVGHRARVLLGPIMPSAEAEEHDEDRLHHSSPKRPGAARLVFLSRITPMKNLSFAVSIASRQPVGQISLDIYGVIDDQSYWADCQRLIAAARDPRVVVTYRGGPARTGRRDVVPVRPPPPAVAGEFRSCDLRGPRVRMSGRD